MNISELLFDTEKYTGKGTGVIFSEITDGHAQTFMKGDAIVLLASGAEIIKQACERANLPKTVALHSIIEALFNDGQEEDDAE